MRLVSAVLSALICGWATVHAQWLDHRTPGTPRLPDGRPNLAAAAAPRSADGKPDLSGVWEVVGDRVMETDGRVRSKYV